MRKLLLMMLLVSGTVFRRPAQRSFDHMADRTGSGPDSSQYSVPLKQINKSNVPSKLSDGVELSELAAARDVRALSWWRRTMFRCEFGRPVVALRPPPLDRERWTHQGAPPRA
jgi:hypothetical protein